MTKKYDVNEQVTRLCRCGETDLSEFYKNKSARGGISYICKSCSKIDARKYNKTSARRENMKRFVKKVGGTSGYYLKYKDTIRKAQRRYSLKDSSKLKHRITQSKRRSKIRSSVGKFTDDQWIKLLDYYSPKNKCLNCGEFYDILEIDHVNPISKGGTNYITNIQPLCRLCNSSKYTKSIDYRPDKGLHAFRLLGWNYV